MPQTVSVLPYLLVLIGYVLAGLKVWPSYHVALSNASVFVDFIANSKSSSSICNNTLSLVNMESNTTLLSRTLPSTQLDGRVEFECSCFLYAGTFRFLLRQTCTSAASQANETETGNAESATWRWSSELQVKWPTFHIAVERAGNQSQSFQVGIFTNEYFQACSTGIDSALFLEVSYMEYNQIGRKIIDKVRARTQKPIRPLRSQTFELPCAFPFTERDYIQVALHSPHTAQDVKNSGPLYLSRIFSYKLFVEKAKIYKSGCLGTMTVKMIAPPCAHISGKIQLFKDPAVGISSASTSAVMGFGPEDPESPPLSFKWLTHGENETEFNCSVFSPGRNKYCFRFVFNFSRSPSPAQTCLVVYRSSESWGPWKPWSSCSVSCGEGVRERVRECLLPSGVQGIQCTGMMKEQSLCSLEDCDVVPSPSPSLPPLPVGGTPLGGNMIVVLGISLCLAVIMATVVVTVWRKLCHSPQCSSVHRGPMHSPGGRKLSDEASICGHSLQRPSLSDSHGPSGLFGTQKHRPPTDIQPVSPQTLILPLAQDPERLSPTGQKVLPPIFGYRLAQQQLKEMKKKGLKEATLLYHVSSSPVQDTVVETSASPANSSAPNLPGLSQAVFPLGRQDIITNSSVCMTSPVSEPPTQTADRLSPRVELVLGPPVSSRSSGRNSKWLDRTADWVEMVERSGLVGQRDRNFAVENSPHRNPNFRRTSSFNDPKPPLMSSSQSRQFRERSMTQVGSRTLPEGRCWNKVWERTPHQSDPIPEHGVSEWTRTRAQVNEQRKPWVGTEEASHANHIRHMGTNTKSLLAERYEADLSGERHKPVGVAASVRRPSSHEVNHLSVDRAEQNWNRRGPSPIQRNILARKLKEAQSYSGAKARKRSSSFDVSSSAQRKGRCNSLPLSADNSSSCGSPYRLSETEQRMIDLDMSTVFVKEEE